MLEPFGCENEKPVFAIKQKDMIVEPISEKAFKHYKCYTKKNNPILGFSFYKNAEICKTASEKLFLVDLSVNKFRGNTSVNALAKSVKVLKADLSNSENLDYMASLYNLYYSIFDFNNPENYHVSDNLKEVIQTKFAESKYGTIVVASSNDDLKVIDELNLTNFVANTPFANAQNVVVACPTQIYSLDDVKGYKNIIFLHKHFDNEHLYFSQKMNVYESAKIQQSQVVVSKDREVSVKVYKHACNFALIKANDVIDFANKLHIKDRSLSAPQILFSLIVFMELNFLEFDDILNSMKVLKAKKVELSSSKFYGSVE